MKLFSILFIILITIAIFSCEKKDISVEKTNTYSGKEISIQYFGEVKPDQWITIDDWHFIHSIQDTVNANMNSFNDMYNFSNKNDLKADTIRIPSSIYYTSEPNIPFWIRGYSTNSDMAFHFLRALRAKEDIIGMGVDNRKYLITGFPYDIYSGKVQLINSSDKEIIIKIPEGYKANIEVVE